MKTLVKPPPEDPGKSPIENVVEVTELTVLGPDIFTNTRPPWHPPGARGVYGGAVIAMSLAAGQRTVPAAFFPHSCHCYFLLAGAGDQPILLHVERVRDGRSFATRTVQARQKGRAIFTATISFVREGSGGAPEDPCVVHAAPMPVRPGGGGVLAPPEERRAAGDEEPEYARTGPFESHRIEVLNKDSELVHTKKTRQWIRARGQISAAGGTQAHLNALAYMSDSYFIGTISRIHRLWRFPFLAEDIDDLPDDVKEHVLQMNDWEGGGTDLSEWRGRPQIGMMVSLDHTIYFHDPRAVRADEWMLSEMESPWAGDGRGLVTQRIFAKDGTLLATCVQEGLVRLKEQEAGQDGEASRSKAKL